MKKMIFVLTALLLAAPALADVTISCSPDGLDVDINYTATEDTNLPRGLGLEISVDNGTIDSISNESVDYWVYPGSITIVDGEMTDQGTPVVGSLPASSIILEMGSLHYPPEVDGGNQPPLSGTLCTLTVSSDCNVTIAGNAERGNVVNYTAEAADATYTGCQVTGDCFPSDHPDYAEWVSVGKPSCWCYPRQCHGDAAGDKEGSAKLGYWYVGNNDLNIMGPAWLVKEPTKGPGLPDVDSICADFAHDKEGSAKLGYWRVGNSDLNAMGSYWLVKEPTKGPGVPADCLDVP